MDIHCPHDNLFKSFMKEKSVAIDFFKHNLPKSIRSLVDFNTLSICSGSYIDGSLKSSASDILYTAMIQGKEAYIYLLCEHQSTIDRLMPYRILQYIMKIWADHLKQKKANKKLKKENKLNKNEEKQKYNDNEKILPLIIPMVFYHGKQPYSASTDIRTLINAPMELIDEFLFKPFHLIDTHNIEDEQLKEQHWAGVMSMVMKHIYARDFMNHIDSLNIFLEPLFINEYDNTLKLYMLLIHYILDTAEINDLDKFLFVLNEKVSKVDKGENMKAADLLIERGKKQNAIHFITNLLHAKFGNLPNKYNQFIENSDVSKINALIPKILKANSLQELFENEQSVYS